MIRILSSLATLASLGYGAYYLFQQYPEVKTKVMDIIYSGNFHTLKARLSAKQIMEANKRKLLKDDRHHFLEPVTLFTPYLLLEIKYTKPDHTTGEGMILWDLTDGEMVMHTQGWDKTHGYADCIKARLTKMDRSRLLDFDRSKIKEKKGLEGYSLKKKIRTIILSCRP